MSTPIETARSGAGPRDAALGTFRRILIAVDGGAPAARAAALGCTLAEALGSEVCLFHALERASERIEVPSDEDQPSARIAGEAIFAPLLAQLPQRVQITEFSHVGEPAKSIEWAVSELAADLLVIGSHGRDGVVRAMLGSVAEAVMRRVPCPVLIVKANIERTLE